MIEAIICYLFSSLSAAQGAEQYVNASLGIPVSDEAVTRTCCAIDSIPADGIYYILHDKMIEDLMGIPDTIFVVR